MPVWIPFKFNKQVEHVNRRFPFEIQQILMKKWPPWNDLVKQRTMIKQCYRYIRISDLITFLPIYVYCSITLSIGEPSHAKWTSDALQVHFQWTAGRTARCTWTSRRTAGRTASRCCTLCQQNFFGNGYCQEHASI